MKLARRIIIFIFLTIITQVGGLVYLLSSWLSAPVFESNKRWKRVLLFSGLYLGVSCFVVPVLSSRVPMPVFSEEGSYRPVTILTCLLNRHYVSQDLSEALSQLKHPNTIQYMDANFPFFDGFPLLPHLSHDDGNKIDLAFQYGTGGTDMECLKLPTFAGYGAFEAARPDEVNTAQDCESKGAWQYSMCKLIPTRKTEARFHLQRTKQLLQALIHVPDIRKIFIEPHLKQRMGMESPKLRFHGCHAVRHDDHIHVEL